MRHLFLIHLFIFLFCFTVSAESIPYEKLVGVWTNSQDGVNHELTQKQVTDLCGMGFAIFHPDRQSEFHIRLKQNGKLMMYMDVLSKEPCTFEDNQLSCQMEGSMSGKSLGGGPEVTLFEKVRDGVYDMTSLMPDGKTVNKVQTGYRCPLTIAEALTWLESNSGPGETGKLTKGMFPPHKVEWLMKKAEAGDVRAQAGMGAMYLMAAVLNTGVEHDPVRGLSLLNKAAALGNVNAFVMLGNSNSLGFLANQSEDYAIAQKWYAKAAQAGHPGAQNAIGFLFLFGLPEQNVSKAIALMTSAAKQGHPSAHFNLSVIEIFFPNDLRKQMGLSLEKDFLSGLMHLKLAQEKQLEGAITVWQSLQSQFTPELTALVEGKLKSWKEKHPIAYRGSYIYPNSDVGIHFKVAKSGQPLLSELDIRAALNMDTMKMDPIYDLYSTSETLKDHIHYLQRCAALFQVMSKRIKAETKDPDEPNLQSKIRQATMFEKESVFLEKYTAEVKGDVKNLPEESQYHIDEIELLYHQRMEIQEQKTGKYLSEQDAKDVGSCQQIYNNLRK